MKINEELGLTALEHIETVERLAKEFVEAVTAESFTIDEELHAYKEFVKTIARIGEGQ